MPQSSLLAASERRAIERLLRAWQYSPPELAEQLERRHLKEQMAAVERLLKAAKSVEHP
jgi:hypothetical protein